MYQKPRRLLSRLPPASGHANPQIGRHMLDDFRVGVGSPLESSSRPSSRTCCSVEETQSEGGESTCSVATRICRSAAIVVWLLRWLASSQRPCSPSRTNLSSPLKTLARRNACTYKQCRILKSKACSERDGGKTTERLRFSFSGVLLQYTGFSRSHTQTHPYNPRGTDNLRVL